MQNALNSLLFNPLLVPGGFDFTLLVCFSHCFIFLPCVLTHRAQSTSNFAANVYQVLAISIPHTVTVLFFHSATFSFSFISGPPDKTWKVMVRPWPVIKSRERVYITATFTPGMVDLLFWLFTEKNMHLENHCSY